LPIDPCAIRFTREAAIAQIREIMDSFDLVQQLLERDVAADLTGNEPGKI
jgi:hypothetical protein